MTGDAEWAPTTAEFESGALPLDVIVVWRAAGGWHAGTVLCRAGTGPALALAPWQEPFLGGAADWDGLWDYLAERIREGRGGNVYTYELDAFSIANAHDITPIITARAAEVVAATYGPLGEIAGTVLFGSDPGTGSVIMPFILLADDRGYDALVTTSSDQSLDGMNLRDSEGRAVKAETYESVEHWQRQGALSWPLARTEPYVVEWNDSQVRFVVAESGGFGEITPLQASDAAAHTEVVGPTADPPFRFDIERVRVPDWIPRDGTDHAGIVSGMAEQLEWGFATPWVFRALASPMTHEPILSAPSVSEPGSPSAYWSALLHLLIYSFGWARPDRGLRWWYNANKPVDDPRLQLISQVWDADGQLDWFAAWLWTTPSIFQSDLLAELTGYHDDGERDVVDERWIETARRSASAAGIATPIGDGGWDELHLSDHSSGPLWDSSSGEHLLRSRKTERKAMLILDSMTGWYRALARHGGELPALGNRSWRVDVVVQPVGHLGTFRRSRVSGLWFSGPHRLHMQGT